MNILVVEDNKKLLETIKKELSKHFDVKGSEDGEEALFLIKQGIYDLIVLDLMLPNIGGLDILKKKLKLNNIKIIHYQLKMKIFQIKKMKMKINKNKNFIIQNPKIMMTFQKMYMKK